MGRLFSNKTFANQLGQSFGLGENAFSCGVGQYSTCVSPSCTTFQSNDDPVWFYLALLSVVNLDTFFNTVYDGIGNGQDEYLGLVDETSEVFFPWKDPIANLSDASNWITAILT